MSESRQIITLLIVVALIGLSGLFIVDSLDIGGPCSLGCSEVYVDSYRGDLYLNGTLDEKFIWEIKEPGKFRMLFRTWKVPLTSLELEYPYIEAVSITSPPGTIPYIKDYRSRVKIFSSSYAGYMNEIVALADSDEAGIYKPEKFDAGIYEINYGFKVHPPLECDGEYCHLNLKIADEHRPYKHFTFVIHDPRGFVSQVFMHPQMDVRKVGDTWVIDGASPENSLLEVEMLLDPRVKNAMAAFPQNISGVKDKTLSANSGYYGKSGIFSALILTLKALVFLFPVILALIYYRYGKEKSFTVPEFLSVVPHQRKPWLVNLVFRKDPFDFDENGFYATLLDMHRRGILKIENGMDKKAEDGLKIRLLKKPEAADDEYEKKVLEFLESFAKMDVFDTRVFEARINELRMSATSGSQAASYRLDNIRERMQVLMKVSEKNAAKEYVVSGKKYVAGFITLFSLVLIAMLMLDLSFGTVYPQLSIGLPISIILVMQSIPPLFVSSALFGRWKENYYKEKLEWDAFRDFLSDFAMIKKYAPEDITMWQEWLVYGTALGVGDKVAKVMEELNVHIPEANTVHYMPVFFGHVYGMTSPPSSGGEGGFSGGGGAR
ncbi:MAG: DUF2207 domain-containing protein [Candidatus Methanoperedens sp.]|nr:DUF2207 domain-containing protein [Candidatus Methanoperedens sp.]MCZ7403887.1 DUF2207 domain-containing protein [Candidatus Methanoperedens sp.]